MNEIMAWIEAEGSGHWFFIVFPVVILCLFIWLKGRRVRFLIPSLLISLAIINPIFYRKWLELDLYAYWRMLWVVPVIPMIAALISSITEKTDKGWVKVVVAAAGAGLIALGGTFIFGVKDGGFSEAANSMKLPDYIVRITDRLLKLEEHPRVVFQYPLGIYSRQYTSDYEQMYGRDIDGFILNASADARNVHVRLTVGDLEAVATLMANDEYDYLVMERAYGDEEMEEAGFEAVDYVAGYGIYRGHGTPTIAKKRNELGQVLSATAVDENGEAVLQEAGYANILYEYDGKGNIIREFRVDTDGKGVADSYGRAGYECEYDENSRLVLYRDIDPNGKAINNSYGYAEYRRTYQGRHIDTESYFDSEGRPVNRIDKYYASVKYEYDSMHHRIGEKYYDISGKPIASNLGYAYVARKYDDGHMVRESYYDIEGKPTIVTKGYASFIRTYDAQGRILTESYLDTEGRTVCCINGYAAVEYEYDREGNVTRQAFKDEKGTFVITPYGYAEVRRTFAGSNLIREEYYGADGKVLTQPAGYAAIAQRWDGDVLVSRIYLGTDDKPTMRSDGFAEATWIQNETGTWNLSLKDLNGSDVPLSGKNLVRDVKTDENGWSEWITPTYNTLNSTYNIGFANLGQKANGDLYTSAIEIEFKGVTGTEGLPFRFWTQGAQDGKWVTGNVWNGNLINLHEAPEDGVYLFYSTVELSGKMENISTFNLGFRCDYWRSGSYRVRNVKIEKENKNSEWSPGL